MCIEVLYLQIFFKMTGRRPEEQQLEYKSDGLISTRQIVATYGTQGCLDPGMPGY